MHTTNFKNLKKRLRSPELLIGIFFITIFTISSIFYIKQKLWYEFFWLSNHWALINGVAFLTRNRFVFSYIVALGIIPEILWVIDFALMSNGIPFLGITNYWFDSAYPLTLKIIALQHLLNPFASIYGIMRFGFHKKAWIGSILHGFSIFIVSLVFFGTKDNVNCVWKNCLPSIPMKDTTWQILLVSAIMLHIFLVTYAAKLFMRRAKKPKTISINI